MKTNYSSHLAINTVNLMLYDVGWIAGTRTIVSVNNGINISSHIPF